MPAPSSANRSRPVLGIVGGGQLGRMLALAAIPLGFDVVVLDPTERSPATQVGARQVVGDFHDAAALQALAESSDVVTIEFEHVDADALQRLVDEARVRVEPPPATIRAIQDKLHQKELLHRNGIPVCRFAAIDDATGAAAVLDDLGGAMIVKTRTGGFDGRGNAVVRSAAELDAALASFEGRPLYAEALVPFEHELAVVIARSTDGSTAAYPVVETVHERNICLEVLAPAPVPAEVAAEAERLAVRVAGLFAGAGVLAIEMFLAADGAVLVNEVAPRVHNSGHWTQQGSRTSQFEQHVRAVTGLPLGTTDLTAPAAVMVNVLGDRDGPAEVTGLADALAVPDAAVHLYGKAQTSVDRKMGHVNATGDDLDEARERARAARKCLSV